MLVLFVDTETAGLPTDYHADPFTNPEAWPRIVEIGWQVRQDVVLGHRREWCRENHGEYLIRPDGFAIEESATSVHKITTERAREEGYPLEVALREFLRQAEFADLIVAHNVGFDMAVIVAELARAENLHACEVLDLHTWQCTMVTTKDFCGLPGRRAGEYKWPRLGELAFKLGVEPVEAHRVAGDVETLARCWIELDRLGFWKS
jgi:DNA polymerase III epsilon subunit-like protein